MRILIAEDERPLARALVKILEKNCYSADAVFNGIDALEYAEIGKYDLIILDIMMPGLNGIGVTKKLRADGNTVPIIILTAKSETDDKVIGLDSGANYYLTKPFDAKELLAVIRTVTRKVAAGDSRLCMGNTVLDRATFELSTDKGAIRLVNKEFQIMEMLMSQPGRLISTERFMEKIWGPDNDAELNVVWVNISYLRKKLLSLESDVQIKASRNAGYSLELKT